MLTKVQDIKWEGTFFTRRWELLTHTVYRVRQGNQLGLRLVLLRYGKEESCYKAKNVYSKAKLETQHGFNNRDESASQTSITLPSVSNPGGEYNSSSTLGCKLPLLYKKVQ